MDKNNPHHNHEDNVATQSVVPSDSNVFPCPPPEDERPIFLGKELRFIEKFVFLRTNFETEREVAEEAGRTLGLSKEGSWNMYRRKKVRAEIQRRCDIVDREVALQAAQAQALTVETLDAELLDAVTAPMAKGIAPAKVTALKMAYGRLKIQIGEPEERPTGPANQGPQIYRALGNAMQTTMLRQTVTEVIQQTEQPIAQVEAAPQKVIEAGDFTFEVEDI